MFRDSLAVKSASLVTLHRFARSPTASTMIESSSPLLAQLLTDELSNFQLDLSDESFADGYSCVRDPSLIFGPLQSNPLPHGDRFKKLTFNDC